MNKYQGYLTGVNPNRLRKIAAEEKMYAYESATGTFVNGQGGEVKTMAEAIKKNEETEKELKEAWPPQKAKEKTTLIRLYEIIYVGLLMLWSKKGEPPLKNTIHEYISRGEYEEDLSSGKLFDKLIREIKETPCDDESGYYLKDSAEIFDHNNIKEIFSHKKILLKELNTKNPVERYTVIYEYSKKYYLWALNKMEMESKDITKQQNFETSDNPPLEI